MPLIEIICKDELDLDKSFLETLSNSICDGLEIQRGFCWILVSSLSEKKYWVPHWNEGTDSSPIVLIRCKETYGKAKNEMLLNLVSTMFCDYLELERSNLFVLLDTVKSGQLYVRNNIWKKMNEINLLAIGKVHNTRKLIKDDNWGEVVSEIKIYPDVYEQTCLDGLEDFSHVNVIFYMDKVRDEKICKGSRHPRNNTDLPKVGILAQRAKSRVNKIGLTICEVVKVDKYSLFVKGLDAIDGTPVLDIKPMLRQFLPKTEIDQPDWVDHIMKDYF